MGRLIYSAIASLDGYVADEEGNFDLAAPDGEVHRFVNDLERAVGTYLYGRRMYEVMSAWAAWVVPSSQHRRSRRAWSTSSSGSSRLPWWEEANSPFPTMSA